MAMGLPIEKVVPVSFAQKRKRIRIALRLGSFFYGADCGNKHYLRLFQFHVIANVNFPSHSCQ
jgi:hypothetical protein